MNRDPAAQRAPDLGFDRRMRSAQRTVIDPIPVAARLDHRTNDALIAPIVRQPLPKENLPRPPPLFRRSQRSIRIAFKLQDYSDQKSVV